VGGKSQRCRTAAREEHAASSGPPRWRSDTVQPVAAKHGLKKAEHGPQAHHRAESSQVRGSHPPITDNPHDRSLRRKGWKTTGNVAGGRVSVRSRRRSVDLASKIKEKSKKKTGQKSPRRRHIGSATPPNKTS